MAYALSNRRTGEKLMPKLLDRGLWLALPSIFVLALSACGDDPVKADKDPDASQEMSPVQGAPDGGTPVVPVVLGDDPLKVQIPDGELEGDALGNSVRFLKIPFAKPPVDGLRWKAPERNDPWTGVRHETGFASPCPQPPSQQSPASQNEDCLYLNVWRPNDNKPGHPVLIWIHGGGFTTGSAADYVPNSGEFLWYNGQPFAERGVVVVTLNYRLGVLGFFAHPGLSGEKSPVGNQGLLDQRMAMTWVRDNIVAFGGDPKNVTIAGESAGAGSVCMHTVSPGSRGLFHRAVSQSGGCTARTTTDRAMLNAQIADFASQRGCTGDDTLACLRGKPVSELVSTAMVDRTMGMDALRRSFSFGAVVDGEGGFLPKSALELYDAGEVAKVPYLLGTNTDEAQLYFLFAPVPANEDEYRASINMTYGSFAERVLAMYPSEKFAGNYRKLMARIASDSGLICSTLDTARRAVKAGTPVFMYNFNIPWSISREALGASHASEISHVFGTPYSEMGEVAAAGATMNAYWTAFIEKGDPNYEGAPAKWPSYMPDASDNDQRLQLAATFEVLANFRKEECKLWREYAAR
jgi:para-nitrobenzyl esterase